MTWDRITAALATSLAIITVSCSALKPTPPAHEVIITLPTVQADQMNSMFLEPVPDGSDGEIRAWLGKKDALVLEGTTLVVAPLGEHRTVTISCNVLKLRKGARIVTNGNNVIIAALTMELGDNGGLMSYPQDALAMKTPGEDGYDGGSVEIRAFDSVNGALAVSLPGQAGGDGLTGAGGDKGPDGSRGGDGSDHIFDCGHQGDDGGAGKPGGTGKAGSKGGNGGKGGSLRLLAKAGVGYEKHFPFSDSGGKGGKGGLGGPGGPGGSGGQGGSGSTYCHGGHGGVGGPPGSQGPQGPNGVDGGEGSLSLK